MKVNNDLFTEVARNGVPKMNPLSYDYQSWWREQKDRCVNGYSVGGKWMPGKLYFFINFWHIELNVGKSKRKQMGSPLLRDLEWNFFEKFEKSRGFSGLKDGIPQYDNESCGVLLIGGRGLGKSYWASCILGHEYTFYKNNELVLSAHESKYSLPLADKVKFGLDNIPGDIEYIGEMYASPFKHRRIKDYWQREIRSGYVRRVNGISQVGGFNSRIIHRLFKDNALAANGTRPSVHVMEEVGRFENLIDSYNSSWECWMNGAYQFGTPFLLGTGGDMDGGSNDAQKMFYDPETYNLLTIDNIWEEGGGKIAYFVPGWQGLNQFKDKDGNTDEYAAKDYLLKRRKKKQKGKDKRAFYQELQYQPFKPSEAFLIRGGNTFPIALLQERLGELLSKKEQKHLGQLGRLEFNMEGKVLWHPDSRLEPLDFPVSGNSEGCVVIWEHPEKDPPYGLYIAGTDPVRQDKAEYSDSIASTFIYKRFYHADTTYDFLVAEYSARPDTVDQYYEMMRKLMMYYNAKNLYENEVKGIKQYFEVKKCLHLLKEQPHILKDIVPGSRVNREYGTHMTEKISDWMDLRVRDWLLEETSPGITNIKKLYSIPLIKELIRYTPERRGTYNRVVSFKLCIMHDLDLHKHVVEAMEEHSEDRFFSKGYKKFGSTVVWC